LNNLQNTSASAWQNTTCNIHDKNVPMASTRFVICH